MRVATIIPVFNAERTIAHTIDSALAQHYEGQEIVVVNDGSTDTTRKILRGFGSTIRIIDKENGGAAAARNTGIAHSNGKYLAFLDSDDMWCPGKLDIMIAALEREPSASLAFSEYGFIDQTGFEYKESSFFDDPAMPDLLKQQPFPLTSFNSFIYPSTWVVRRTVVERSGGFPETFKGAGYEDSWMLFLLRDLGEFVYVPCKLTLYRLAPEVATSRKYLSGLPTFERLIRDRYGSRGKAIIRSVKNINCRNLLSESAHQMDEGDRFGAMNSLLQIAKLRPAYFLSSEFTRRVLLPQNLRRVRHLSVMALRNRGLGAD